jgi:hypothetical protein
MRILPSSRKSTLRCSTRHLEHPRTQVTAPLPGLNYFTPNTPITTHIYTHNSAGSGIQGCDRHFNLSLLTTTTTPTVGPSTLVNSRKRKHPEEPTPVRAVLFVELGSAALRQSSIGIIPELCRIILDYAESATGTLEDLWTAWPMQLSC